MEKDCAVEQVNKAKVKLPRNLGTKADLFKVAPGTDKITDKDGLLC